MPDGIEARLRVLLCRAIERQRIRLILSAREVEGVAGLPAGSLTGDSLSVGDLRDALRVLRPLHPVRPLSAAWRARGLSDATVAALFGGPRSVPPEPRRCWGRT